MQSYKLTFCSLSCANGVYEVSSVFTCGSELNPKGNILMLNCQGSFQILF